MKLRIYLDGIPHEIDSTDPALLGTWVIEIFARAIESGISPATHIETQAFPSFVPDKTQPSGFRPDWIADSRIITELRTVKTPRELVDALYAFLDEKDKLDG